MGDTPGAVTVGVGIGRGGRAGNGAFGIDIGISLARITVEGRLIPPTVFSFKALTDETTQAPVFINRQLVYLRFAGKYIVSLRHL